MKKMTKKIFSLLLAFTLVFGALPTNVFAAKAGSTTVNVNKADKLEDVQISLDELGSFSLYSVNKADEDVVLDEEDPAIIGMKTELENIKVLNAEGDPVPLTAEQIGQVLYLFQEYLNHWKANAHILGVQVPFFLSFNDKGEDGLGILGEMLALAGVSVDAVRAGYMTFDDITGMIQNFMYGDALGVQLYGQAIATARDEALAAIKASGAKTEAQKLLVLNDWLAHNVIFDMPYIMNNGKADNEKPMVAANPQDHKYKKTVYDVIYADYEKQLKATFEQQIMDGLKAEFKKQFYVGAIEAGYKQGVIDNALPQIEAAIIEQATKQVYDEAYAAAYEQLYAAEYEKAFAAEYEKAYEAEYEKAYEAEEAKVYDALLAAEAEAAVRAKYEVAAEAELSEEQKAEVAALIAEPTEDLVAAVEAKLPAEEAAIKAAAETAAKAAAEAAAKAPAEETAKAAAEEAAKAVAEAQVAENEAAIKESAKAEAQKQAEAAAEEETAKFMAENEAAINADPVAFVEGAFGAEAAAQIAAQFDAFWADAEQNGIALDPSKPEEKTTFDQILAQQMNTAMDDLQGMTPNQAIPVFADQAATGLTDGVLNYWAGSHIGALGDGQAVCLGYSKAFAYIVQFMHPEIYGKSANADLKKAENWKTADELYYNAEGNLDINNNYAVDLVRITFDASVTMFGETEDNFNSDHFWNAVKLDGKWYYVDPCYTDVFVEVMSRDRVETDGNMNHLYFLFSHSSAVSLYDGNYSTIKTLYDGSGVTATTYEDAWFSRAVSNTYSDGNMFYYVYDSTDMITLLDDFNNNQDFDMEELSTSATEYKLVGHKITNNDANANGDTDYTTYIEFNYKENEDDEESVARVLDASGKMVENELLTKLFAQHEAESAVYPSIKISTALHNNKLYFNLSNCILAYDLSSKEVALVKEYNTVSAVRDNTNPFGGMAFTVTTADKADFTVENHPIASMTIKDDGNMYVSVATNFAFISGKDPHNSADQGSYGYEFEESNYNAAYNSQSNNMSADFDDSMLESFGYEKETNDNDEFMWTTNFVEKVSMSHLAGNSHSYKEVEVDAFCGRNAYTEERCTSCGKTNPEVERVEVEESAHDHHYIRFDETYYTKTEGKWNTGFCYLCTACGKAVEEPTEPDPDTNYEEYDTTYEEQLAIYEEEKAIYDAAKASAGHKYVITDPVWAEEKVSISGKNLKCSSVCPERKNTLDALLNDKTIEVTLNKAAVIDVKLESFDGVCSEGGTAVYTGTSVVDGRTITATLEYEVPAGEHAYEVVFNWNAILDADGNPTGHYEATADFNCVSCSENHTGVVAEVVKATEEHKDPTCTENGQDVFYATATVTDAAGNATTVKEQRIDIIPYLGHTWGEISTPEPGMKVRECSVCKEVETRYTLGWIEEGEDWYYRDEDGTLVKGWFEVDGDWYYFDKDGKMIKGWYEEDGARYYFDSAGKMKTGWMKSGDVWYYFDSAGKMKTGWMKDTSTGKEIWYFFNTSGEMVASEWITDNGKKYYMDSAGEMKTGWLKYNGEWYYLDNSGAMKTGWLQYEGDWYYFEEDGTMATNKWIGDSYVDADGIWDQSKTK